jgi:hypothetical protein
MKFLWHDRCSPQNNNGLAAQRRKMMARFFDKLQKIFSAAAFAEAGEHDTARQIAGLPEPKSGLGFDRLMAAITFAEEGYPDMARQFLGMAPQRAPIPIRGFLADVGLGHVRCRYLVAVVA